MPDNILENEFYISRLLNGYFNGSLSAEEQARLEVWLDKSVENRKTFEQFKDEESVSTEFRKFESYGNETKTAVWNRTVERLGYGFGISTVKPRAKIFSKKLWARISVAAAMLLVFGAGLYFYRTSSLYRYEKIDFSANDIPAGGSKAFITLANGKTISLSGSKRGVVVGASTLKYDDGTTIVTNPSFQNQDTDLLTLTTPRGGQYQITLSDGTLVYMNAGSSLKYPTAFNTNFRTVTLQGEAYFEVAQDKRRPFMVKTARQTITVLGTHFNVNAYSDEVYTKTTLLEGSVRVNDSTILKPGEQALLDANGISVADADIKASLAWKNGDFIFNEEPLESILRQVSRWYDVEIIYATGAPRRYIMGGVISRTRSLSFILSRMEVTGKVRFNINGRKITVLPAD